MKKIILSLIVIFSAASVLAASPKPDYTVKNAINKYKIKNYTGCMQDLENYINVEKKETALAYYYLAMAYTQAEKREEAIESYNKAIELAQKEKNNFLKSYSLLGLKKIEHPEAFKSNDEFDDASNVISRKTTIPSAVTEDLKLKHLEYIRGQINAGVKPKF